MTATFQKIQLRDYQLAAADQLLAILKEHQLAYLAGEVRTGKTLTVLHVIRQLLSDEKDWIGINPVAMIVTKKKAISSIQADVEAIGLGDLVRVINYEQLHKYQFDHYKVLVVDEAHGVGAYPKPSKRFRDLCQLSHQYLVLMSGTPSPESYSQLYHQFTVSTSSSQPWRDYGTFYAWAKRYVTVKQKHVGMSMPVNDYSDARKDLILADIEPFVVRMTQSEAGFQQQIAEQVHYVKMKKRTYRMAKRIMDDGVIGRPGRRAVLADSGAKVMSKLRQLWSGTIITEEHGAIITDDSKARYIVEQFNGKKVAILYTFVAERQMLDIVLAKAGIWATETPENFNDSDCNTWFRGQVQSCREGVNLSAADDLVFVGVDYSALSYLQGRDRASHWGRTRANRVHWILADGGLERRVFNIVKAKEDFTVAHYRRIRGEVSGEINQALGGNGLDCCSPAANLDWWNA